MQESHYNNMDLKAFTSFKNEDAQQQLRALNEYEEDAQKIKVDMEKALNLNQAGMRTPDAAELREMEIYMVQYRKNKPKSTTREVRRAVQRKFGLVIVPDNK